MRTIVKFWMSVSMVLLVSACGYKPSSHMIQNVFSDTVYVEVIVDRAEPENAPFIKDEMSRLVYTRFKGRVVSKAQAESQIRLSYAGSTFTPLSYKEGYVTRYRANTRVKFDMVTKEGKVSKTISSIVDSEIQESSLTSSALRTEAIRIGLGKALDEFLAYVSAKGMLKETK
ncbi:lipoprotein [Sulfurovum sp. TSL6]|uniref:LPS assembly lipoprotein LptE n=1 Tax=Sulfurovum sp. TSL6 TaxID=2826995 RepID=UPI001CC64BDF|nr:LPS assembly lipoprotein LptE [Sulfurovum sp. TSL6]GIU00909.1 lipoprotein [Sulfurovum sp. TSL6]